MSIYNQTNKKKHYVAQTKCNEKTKKPLHCVLGNITVSVYLLLKVLPLRYGDTHYNKLYKIELCLGNISFIPHSHAVLIREM